MVGHSLHSLAVRRLDMDHTGASSGAFKIKEDVDEDLEDEICVHVVVYIHIITTLINIHI